MLQRAKKDKYTGEYKCVRCGVWFEPREGAHGRRLCSHCYSWLGAKEEE